MFRKALISKCKQYRFTLTRIWDQTRWPVMFIMLNPSTADAEKDDPTIRRCIGYAKEWGYGGIHIGNLCAYRSTDPKNIKGQAILGSVNFAHLVTLQKLSNKVICAWGHKMGWPDLLTSTFNDLHYLELGKDGTPKHPLYLKKNLIPILKEKNV